jgi:hypothetical protein
MKSFLNFGLALVLAGLVSGCEWDGSGSEGSWNDSYSWINFSGLYRGSNGPIVGNFTTATVTDDAPDTTPVNVVNNENGGTAPDGQTVLNGVLAHKPGITPGSVTIVFLVGSPGGSSGTATDNGSGVLSGSVNLVGLDPSSALPMTGTINYDTGAWTLNLSSPGLLSPSPIRISYTYSATAAATGGTGSSTLSIAGGDVNTMLVEQVGNRLRFVDSNGNEYSGVLSVVSLAGGDRTGLSSGDVSATYEVKGTAAGKTIKITGSFTGAYVAPGSSSDEGESSTASVLYGSMTRRIIEGIWMQPGGTADVKGVAPSLTVAVTTTH